MKTVGITPQFGLMKIKIQFDAYDENLRKSKL